jgi:hypothetical protein
MASDEVVDFNDDERFGRGTMDGPRNIDSGYFSFPANNLASTDIDSSITFETFETSCPRLSTTPAIDPGESWTYPALSSSRSSALREYHTEPSAQDRMYGFGGASIFDESSTGQLQVYMHGVSQ